MKTPMQELIEWLDNHGDTRIYGGRELTAHEIKRKAESMIEKEKDEIIDAHIDGQCDDTDGTPFEKAEQYYNETFNTKER